MEKIDSVGKIRVKGGLQTR